MTTTEKKTLPLPDDDCLDNVLKLTDENEHTAARIYIARWLDAHGVLETDAEDFVAMFFGLRMMLDYYLQPTDPDRAALLSIREKMTRLMMAHIRDTYSNGDEVADAFEACL